jgi:hypothetical protein
MRYIEETYLNAQIRPEETHSLGRLEEEISDT